MKTTLLITASLLLAASLAAAEGKDEVAAAARKLAAQTSYSWKTTVAVPEGSRWRPGPTEGKTEKDGYTHVTMSFGDNTTQMAMKGDKAAMTNQDGEWQSTSDLENEEGRSRFMAMMARSFKAPAAQAADLVTGAKELKKDGEAYAGELTEDAAKAQLMFRRSGGDGPSASDAKGTVKFWLKEGVLTKFEFKVSGKVAFGGNEREVDRTTTVEIKDVGAAKVSLPDEAKKKLS